MRESANVFGSFLSSVQGVGEKSVQRAVESVANSFSSLSNSVRIEDLVDRLGKEKPQEDNRISKILKIVDQGSGSATVAYMMKEANLSVDVIVAALKDAQEAGLVSSVALPDDSRYYKLTQVGKSVISMMK